MGVLITEEELKQIVNPNPLWSSVTPIAPPTPPPLATAAEVASLRAEVESLKKELDNLRVVVATLRAESEGTGPHPYRITACPRCCSSALYYSTIGSADGPTKYQITCRDCNWKRFD